MEVGAQEKDRCIETGKASLETKKRRVECIAAKHSKNENRDNDQRRDAKVFSNEGMKPVLL